MMPRELAWIACQLLRLPLHHLLCLLMKHCNLLSGVLDLNVGSLTTFSWDVIMLVHVPAVLATPWLTSCSPFLPPCQKAVLRFPPSACDLSMQAFGLMSGELEHMISFLIHTRRLVSLAQSILDGDVYKDSAVFRWSQVSCLAWLHLRHQREPFKFGRRDSSSQVSVGLGVPRLFPKTAQHHRSSVFWHHSGTFVALPTCLPGNLRSQSICLTSPWPQVGPLSSVTAHYGLSSTEKTYHLSWEAGCGIPILRTQTAAEQLCGPFQADHSAAAWQQVKTIFYWGLKHRGYSMLCSLLTALFLQMLLDGGSLNSKGECGDGAVSFVSEPEPAYNVCMVLPPIGRIQTIVPSTGSEGKCCSYYRHSVIRVTYITL